MSMGIPYPYFADCVESVVGPYLLANGFEVDTKTARQIVYRRRDEMGVRFAYWWEDLPQPFVVVGIGFVRDHHEEQTFAAERAVPQGEAKIDYTSWRFHDSASLLQSLCRIERFLKRYVEPLWGDPEAMATLLQQALAESEVDREKVRIKQALAIARRAFSEGRYVDAIRVYSEVENALTALDRRMIYQSQKILEGVDSDRALGEDS